MSPSLLRLVPRRARTRMLASLAAGAALGVAIFDLVLPLRLLIGWNAFAFMLLSLEWATIWGVDARETKARAKAEDPGRRWVWILATLASTFSLFAATVGLRQARLLVPGRAVLWVILCLTAVALSWLLTQTAWALRYAHLYYREAKEGTGGLVFQGDQAPDNFDFAYFAFTIGICFQTSDVSITSPVIRRSVLFHATLSFAYTTAIIALALNLAFGFAT